MAALMNGIDYTQRRADLTAAGVDPDGPDTAFGVPYVYCNQHLRAHSTGWCSVDNLEKFALAATGTAEATAEARAAGFYIFGDPVACKHCQTPLTLDSNGWQPQHSGTACTKGRYGHQPLPHTVPGQG